MDEIDLGKPSMGLSDPMPMTKAQEPEKYYPTVYIDLDADQLGDIPSCGEITFYFETKEKKVSERDGKKQASVTLELQKITDCEEDEEDDKPAREKAGDVLDKYAKEASKE